MTVRVLLDDRSVSAPVRSRRRARAGVLRWIEYLFLIAGLVAVDYYIWVNVEGKLSQAYESWSFDEQLKGRQPSLLGFLKDGTAIGALLGESSRSSQDLSPVPQEQAAAPKPAPKAAPGPRLPIGAVVGRVEIPRLDMSLIVREGVDEKTLRKAVGHVPSTALPGEMGNVAIAAHRDTFFRGVRNIRKGDEVVLSTLQGTYTFVVDSMKIVLPENVGVLKPVANTNTLTLITCYPFNYVGAAPKRFIVRATQVTSTQRPQQGS